MTKPDGRKKGGKGNKGDKKEVVAKAAKQKKVKVPGPKPDFTPHAKTSETFQTLDGAWNGYHGLVSVDGMKFHFSADAAEDGSKVDVVRLVSAPRLTKLSDVSDFKTSIKLSSLKETSFVSDFEKGDPRYEVQAKIWKFLAGAFSRAGFKLSYHKKTETAPKAVELKHEEKTSSSVADFESGKLGMYCFDKEGPCAVFALKQGVVAPHFVGKVKSSTKIELVSVDVGHPLYGYVKPGAYIFLNQLSWGKIPSFTGPRAGECVKLWEFATDIVAEHRKMSKKPVVSLVANTQGMKPGDKVPVPAEYREFMKAA